jgi:hypothetical protein
VGDLVRKAMDFHKHVQGGLLFLIISSFSYVHVTPIDPKKIVLLQALESKNSFICFVKVDGIIYLVKQKKDFKKQLATVRDALAAYIVEGLHIAHKVNVIGYKTNFLGKVRPTWPATLHTVAPGSTIREQRNCIYNALRLKQQWAYAQSFEEKGLTWIIINHMTWHRQLVDIIAADLFIGNSDRHSGNLCYDLETDTFCAIDMDDAFNKDLCALAF